MFFVCSQSSEDLDTDTEFEPVEDMTLETRSRCNLAFFFVFCMLFYVFLLYIGDGFRSLWMFSLDRMTRIYLGELQRDRNLLVVFFCLFFECFFFVYFD